MTFQRTRGVLRLMAAVIHSLWEKGDRGPLILPANLSIDDSRVQFELTRYLPDYWVPVIEKDVGEVVVEEGNGVWDERRRPCARALASVVAAFLEEAEGRGLGG